MLYIAAVLSLSAETPNGYILQPVWFDRDNPRLLDSEGKEILPAGVDNLEWCDEIIHGSHYVRQLSWPWKPKWKSALFLYDGKAKRLRIFKKYKAYDAALKEYDLPAWKDMPKGFHDVNLRRTISDAPCPRTHRDFFPGRYPK